MAEYDIAVIGGDRRTAFMIPFFQENGYRVISFGIRKRIRKTRMAGRIL